MADKEKFRVSDFPTSSNAGYSFNDTSNWYYYSPSSGGHYLVVDVVVDVGKPYQQIIEVMLNMNEITMVAGPAADSPEYFMIETRTDNHSIKGDWATFKQQFKSIVNVWDSRTEPPQNT